MRKLSGEEKAEVIEEVENKEEMKAEKRVKERWLPYTGPGSLEEAKYKPKDRVFKDSDGSLRSIRETVVEAEGAPRYSVEGNDLLEWRKGRGGTKRRLIRTFKAKFLDTPIGRENKKKQAAFRAMLRSKGIPGA